MKENRRTVRNIKRSLPIMKNEDVAFSAELADDEDFEAKIRAERADVRQENR